MADINVGFATGRFQIFHNGHLEYIVQAKKRASFLIIGICNPDVTTTYPNKADAFRHRLEHNPFTYYERLMMIKESLVDFVDQSSFQIVPCPINKPELITNYIPVEAVHLTRIYDQWGHEKIQILKKIGYSSIILYESESGSKHRTWKTDNGSFFKIESGRDVRRRLATDNDWQTFVPQGTARIIKEFCLSDKLTPQSRH